VFLPSHNGHESSHRPTDEQVGWVRTHNELLARLAESERREAAWMNGVADAVERFGYDRDAARGPADLLPGLAELRAAAAGHAAERALADELADLFKVILPYIPSCTHVEELDCDVDVLIRSAIAKWREARR
jgi:hypothetical protein